MVRARTASRSGWVVAGAVTALLAIVALALAGGGNDMRSARETLGRYLQALRHGDAAAACNQLTSSSREQLGQVGSQLLLVSGKQSCPATMQRLLHSGAGPRLRGMARTPVRKVVRDGDVVRAYLAGRSAPLVVRRDHGDWRVAGDEVAAGGVFSS
jgi:hypothetical protein